jgi:beta-lactamase superfamily II metal-dependent hydrolase
MTPPSCGARMLDVSAGVSTLVEAENGRQAFDTLGTAAQPFDLILPGLRTGQ